MDNELRQTVRALTRLTRLVERAAGEVGLAHYRVLSAIADGDERASRLAARLALGKPTISASVDALTRKGLITREGVPGDQRASSLRLTDAGRATLAAVESEMAAALRQISERAPEVRAALAALTVLGGAIDRLRGEWQAARDGGSR